MNFDSWQAFWHMHGYAPFVWSAYGIALVVLIANIAVPLISHRRLIRRIRKDEFRDD
jgi:heme exporter protein D